MKWWNLLQSTTKQSQLQTATTTYCYTSVLAEAPLARSWYKTNKSATQQHQTTTSDRRHGYDGRRKSRVEKLLKAKSHQVWGRRAWFGTWLHWVIDPHCERVASRSFLYSLSTGRKKWLLAIQYLQKWWTWSSIPGRNYPAQTVQHGGTALEKQLVSTNIKMMETTCHQLRSLWR